MAENIGFSYILVVCLCSSFVSASVPPTAGPFTELVGGVRPFRAGDVITHRCIVVGGDPSPEFDWNCLNHIHKDDITSTNGQTISQINIILTGNETDVYQCSCVVTHPAWNDSEHAITKPVLFRTKPIISSQARHHFVAKSGLPVSVHVSFYAYPDIHSVGVFNKDYIKNSNAVTMIFNGSSSITFQFKKYTLTTLGYTTCWRINSFNEADYGKYKMKMENDKGITSFDFTISKEGPPSEPFNVTIYDVTSGGFTVSFNPGFDGGFQQSFAIRYWQREHDSENSIVRFDFSPVRILNLKWSTEYEFVLYAENKKGHSVYSNVEPLLVQTKEPTGTHKVFQTMYGILGVCFVVFMVGCVTAVLHYRRYRRQNEVDSPSLSSRSTINTGRGFYINQAVFQRNQGLPDADAVDRVSNQKKPRRPIKIPPILAIFRKSRLLPDCAMLSVVHDVISARSSSNGNGSDESREGSTLPLPSRTHRPVDPASNRLPGSKKSSTMPTLPSNFPQIQMKCSKSMTPNLQDHGRTDNSQVQYDPSTLHTNSNENNYRDDNDYGRIFFDGDTLIPQDDRDSYGRIFFDSVPVPPSAYSEAPTLPARKHPMKV